jgi:hypothetical protein
MKGAAASRVRSGWNTRIDAVSVAVAAGSS